MGISYYLIIIFGLPLTYAYATLWQSVAGNSTFRGIVYCNLGTPKTVISNFVPTRQIDTPYSSPSKYGYPSNVPIGQKNSSRQKSQLHFCINSLVPYKLSHDRWLWFLFWALTGPYPTLRFGGACGLGVRAF